MVAETSVGERLCLAIGWPVAACLASRYNARACQGGGAIHLHPAGRTPEKAYQLRIAADVHFLQLKEPFPRAKAYLHLSI